MGIDLATTTLWAELASWKPAALDVIRRSEYWAVHGATRMGKALTFEDRVPDDALDAACLAAGAATAKELMELLSRAETTSARWAEPAPPAVNGAEEVAAAIDESGELVGRMDPDGLDIVLMLAHAAQVGVPIGPDADEAAVRAVLESPPQAAQRSSGPFASLLAASTDTIWIPVPLRSSWDSPSGVYASATQLARDLEALPRFLRGAAVPVDLVAAGEAIGLFLRAVAAAGSTHCVRMSG